VRENYLKAFEKLKDSENVVVVDGNQEPEAIAAEIWEKIEPYFSAHCNPSEKML
jgi:thymidylate kinase